MVDFIILIANDSHNYRMHNIKEAEDIREKVNFCERTIGMKVISDLLD